LPRCAGKAGSPDEEPWNERRENGRHVVNRRGSEGQSPANRARYEPDKAGVIEISRLRVERVAGVERFAVGEADPRRGIESHDEEGEARSRE
jgi:hypothetical protein